VATFEAAENEHRNQETLYLLSIPGMLESIHQGLKEPIEKCSETPGW
jgi:antitoxin YefM